MSKRQVIEYPIASEQVVAIWSCIESTRLPTCREQTPDNDNNKDRLQPTHLLIDQSHTHTRRHRYGSIVSTCVLSIAPTTIHMHKKQKQPATICIYASQAKPKPQVSPPPPFHIHVYMYHYIQEEEEGGVAHLETSPMPEHRSVVSTYIP